MESLTANQAKTNFGSMLLKAQVEPVQISKNGRQVAVVMSAEQYEALSKALSRSLRESANRVQTMSEQQLNQLADSDAFLNDLAAGRYD
ncbi:type II toxin-antitoxin system Phd/YefM family antitoxin [Arsukibacterium indicum]|uniref:Antitoxin n=1 Tax=Arsukibacterium indicum TaxID=2848612 RepID=A0ABS6MP52_9GAMM|nr:type II toxin-antitoxin system prevent-host-death family antitoxin [Arsukibacterium indicum]MBV2130582.1 type II toxin-antitoxin system prevent-host-death family antitoxin [Arsukibacterium indicum]